MRATVSRVQPALAPGMPSQLREQLEDVHVPLAGLIARRRAALGRSIVVGLAGGQGAGKSTLAALLAALLREGFGLRAVALSIDDFYFTREERERLAADVHPELRTRGMPGTHDVALAARTLLALRDARDGATVRPTRFDKAVDDRVPESSSATWIGPTDVVLFEGACVGAEPEPDRALDEAINAFERECDPDGSLRRHGNAQLAGPYRGLFALLDALVFVAVPDLAHVRAWRGDQERALGVGEDGRPRGMAAAEIERFVERFERVTRRMLRTAPSRADVTLALGDDHRVAAVRVRGAGGSLAPSR